MDKKKPRSSINFSSKEENSSKQVFIITPIGEQNSEVRDEADALINGIIKPTLIQLGFLKENMHIPHEMLNPGSITRDIVRLVFESDLVIANLTGENPNVYYEVAIRHFSQKPLILMACEGTEVRFDVADQRVLSYTTQMSKSEEYRDMLNESILELSSFEGANIISSYAQFKELKKQWAEQGNATVSSDLGEQILKSINLLDLRMKSVEKRIYGLASSTAIITGNHDVKDQIFRLRAPNPFEITLKEYLDGSTLKRKELEWQVQQALESESVMKEKEKES